MRGGGGAEERMEFPRLESCLGFSGKVAVQPPAHSSFQEVQENFLVDCDPCESDMYLPLLH